MRFALVVLTGGLVRALRAPEPAPAGAAALPAPSEQPTVELAAVPPRRRPRALRVAATCLRIAVGLVGGFTLVLALCLSLPRFAGVHAFTELTGSMRPVLKPGDVVLVKNMPAREAKVGQVVTFQDPANRKRLLTHRVRSITVKYGSAKFVTKGDANDASERWSVDADGQVGRLTHRIPLLGYALVQLSRRTSALLFITLPSILLGIIELRRIWRKP